MWRQIYLDLALAVSSANSKGVGRVGQAPINASAPLTAHDLRGVRVHFLDAASLSESRRDEMPPVTHPQDGLHWTCISKLSSYASRCIFELSNDKQRPDEVGWAAMQVALAMLCRVSR